MSKWSFTTPVTSQSAASNRRVSPITAAHIPHRVLGIMAPPLVMEVFGLLLVVAALVRTAPVQETGGIGDQSSCTERRVQYWSERSRDAVQRIKDTRFDLDTKIEVLGNFATTKDLEDYEKMVC